MEDLGERINKLKSYVKDLAGRTPKSQGRVPHFPAKMDDMDIIIEGTKLGIVPKYLKIEKKAV